MVDGISNNHSNNDKVINIMDAMREKEEKHQDQPVTENIDLGEVSAEDVINAFSVGDLSALKDLGMTEEELRLAKLQMEQYQKESQRKQAMGMIGACAAIIKEKYPEEHILPNEDETDFIYEELNQYLCDKAIEKMNEAMDKRDDEFAEFMKGIFLAERAGNHIVDPKDRLENKFSKVDRTIYDIEIPGTKYKYLSDELFSVIKDQTIDDNLVSYRILEFVANSVNPDTALLDDETRYGLITRLSETPRVLDSIALGKIATYVIEETLASFEEPNRDYAKGIINTIFPNDKNK